MNRSTDPDAIEEIPEKGGVTSPKSTTFASGLVHPIRWILTQGTRETSSGRFIPEIDGLRFIAIGMVILFHLNGYLLAKSPQVQYSAVSDDWLAQIAVVGFRGVELFFAISGFILGLPFAAHYLQGKAPVNLGKYYLRRLTRLEPPYLVAVVLLFLLACTVQGKSAHALFPHFAASLFYLHGLIYGEFSPVIGVGWSLEIEIQFYLLVPLLTCLFMVRSKVIRRAVMVGAILLLLSLQTLFLPSSDRIALSLLAYLQFFLTGFILADIFISDWKQSPRQSFAWDVVSLCTWPALIWILHSEGLTRWMFPFAVLLLYCSAFRGRLSSRILRNRVITVIGGMCYSIYLLHYEVISAVGRLTKTIAEGKPYYIYLLVQFGFVGVSIILICGIYFFAIERPCMHRDWPQRLWHFVHRTPSKMLDGR